MTAFAITFAYNETFYLPRWIEYYSNQLGAQNLYIIDHGSTDLSTHNLKGVNLVRVPRSGYNEVQRIECASELFNSLLEFYDAGFVSDADEFIVADPAKYKNLSDFAAKTPSDALTCVGVDLFHIRSSEPAFVSHLPILGQRRHVMFNSWMCKRSFSRRPIRFGGGFHTSDLPIHFDEDLFLIHTKNFDYDFRLVRQSLTASWNYIGDHGTHARRPLSYVEELFAYIDDKALRGKIRHDMDFRKQIVTCLQRATLNQSEEYDFNIDGGFEGPDLNILPKRFWTLF